MVQLIMTILFAIPAQAPVAPVQVDPIIERIAEVNPKLRKDEAYRTLVAQSIRASAIKHKVKAEKLFAILAQESKFRVGAINKKSHDYGIGQINHRTIEAFGFDQQRLLTDVAYSVEASATVLADFKKRHGKREANFWSRYNSGTPSKRQAYEILVAQYM